MATEIDFYWDVGSTNTYFALHLIRPIAARHGATIRFRPFNLGYVFRHHNYVLMEEPRAKLANRGRDLRRWAARYGLPFRVPDEFPVKTSHALKGALAAARLGAEEPYIDEIFRRYWEQNDASIQTLDGTVAAGVAAGLDGPAFRAAIDSNAVRQELIDATHTALDRGVFGAPSFFVGDELFWGKDRMEFIDDELARLAG